MFTSESVSNLYSLRMLRLKMAGVISCHNDLTEQTYLITKDIQKLSGVNL